MAFILDLRMNMKLNNVEHEKIWNLYSKDKIKVKDLAQQFGVSKSTIYRVLKNKKINTVMISTVVQNNREQNKQIECFQNITTKSEFAKLIGVSPVFLTRVLYMTESPQYSVFTVPKKSGGDRKIHAPNADLKSLQSKLSAFLYKILRIIRRRQKSKNLTSFGFEQGKSIYDNALQHKNVRNILNIDLENFFDSFNFGRVRGFFIKNDYFQLSPEIATVIAQIACYDNKLPQGSPVSPVITNLICNILDIRLRKLAIKNRCKYTRYADDITFSTNDRQFSKDLLNSKQGSEIILGESIEKEIQRAGFQINYKKVRITNKQQRQEVTGLVVNKQVGVKIEYYKRVRAMCDSLFRTGSFYCADTFPNKVEGTLSQLEGYLNFINGIEIENKFARVKASQKKLSKEKYKESDKKILEIIRFQQELCLEKNNKQKLFADFLFYKYFFGHQKPTILTEGKTDIIYLYNAMRSRAEFFPKFVNTNENGSLDKLRVSLFNKNMKSQYFLRLSEGCDSFRDFIAFYSKHYEYHQKLSNKEAKYPVIIVLDNDDIGKVLSSIVEVKKKADKNDSSIKIDRKKDFLIHVVKNLYVVIVPSEQEDKVIEDCFTSEVLSVEIDGRKFNVKNTKHSKNEYGKNVFSQYIKNNMSKIDFSGFDPLLSNIQKCILHYDELSMKTDV